MSETLEGRRGFMGAPGAAWVVWKHSYEAQRFPTNPVICGIYFYLIESGMRPLSPDRPLVRLPTKQRGDALAAGSDGACLPLCRQEVWGCGSTLRNGVCQPETFTFTG